VTGSKLESRFRVFGRPCHLVLKLDHDVTQENLLEAEQEFRRIESKFDSFEQTSLIGQINQRAGSGEFTALDAEARSLFQYAHILWDQSNHLFDPTACLLRRFYDDSPTPVGVALDMQRDLSLIGWSKLEVNDRGAHLSQAGALLDLNNCVRPYAVDRVRKVLAKSGVKNALIDLDQDVATLGRQPDGANWLVGMRYPSGGSTSIERFKLNDRSYTTRGDFERALTIKGERFGRALSPVDGFPIPGLLCIAVIADSCLEACSAASIARLKTEENALRWLNSIGLPWLAIDRQLNCHGPLVRSVPLQANCR
jgi:thiamine biosynthesis lipoprotein